MNASKPPTRMGRPPRFPDEGPRIGHSLRLKPSIDQALREASERNSRSLAEELEHRINKSFDDESEVERIVEFRVNKRVEIIRLKSEMEKASYEWRQALDTKFLCSMYKIDLVHKGGLLRRLKVALGNKIIKTINIEGDKNEINIRDLEEKEKMAVAKLNYWRERYIQLTAEITGLLRTDNEARITLREDEIRRIMNSNEAIERNAAE